MTLLEEVKAEISNRNQSFTFAGSALEKKNTWERCIEKSLHGLLELMASGKYSKKDMEESASLIEKELFVPSPVN